MAEIEPTGTSDETPEEAGARRVGLRVEGKLVMLEIDDPELAESLEKAMAGRKVRIIRGTDPEAEAAGFPGVWSAVSRTRRGPDPAAGPGPAFEPPGMAGSRGGLLAAAGAGPDGGGRPVLGGERADRLAGYLEVGPGTGREKVRAWLLDVAPRTPAGAGPPGTPGGAEAAVLWLAINGAGDGFPVAGYGFGPAGPPDAESMPLEALVDAAIADLSVAA